MDYLSARTTKVTILAYVTQHSLLAEYVVAKKCLEIMDETTTRLAFEFEGLWLKFNPLFMIRLRGQYHKAANAIRRSD